MLQEADNRIHSDSIHCYKRQTIEYTLTVYNVTRGRQYIHSDSIQCYKRQTIEHCYKRQTRIHYTLLQEADNRIHSDSIQCYKRQTIEYTLTVYTVTRGRQ